MACKARSSRFAPTIAGSNWWTLGFVLLALGCAQQVPARASADAGERPPPHLRGAADAAASLPHHGHTDPMPVPQAGVTVSLGGMLAYADQHAPVLLVARSTRSRVEAAQVGASNLFSTNPELSVAVGPRMGVSGTGVDVDLALMQELQLARERGARKAAAERLGDLTDAEIEQVRWAVHCDVHAAFHLALVEQERARLAQRVVTFQKEVLLIAERQIAAGEAAPVALRLAQAEVAQAGQVLVAAEQAFFAARIRLAQLSDWPVLTPPLPAGALDASRDPPSLDRLVVVAREHLPSLRAGQERVRAASARSLVAEREAWPRPAIGIQYRREGNPTTEGPYDTVMGAVSMEIPSFQLQQGARAEAHAEETIARAEIHAAQRLLVGRIAELRSEVVAAAARTRAYGSEILPRFEEDMTLLRRSFELGEIDILALSTGRERFLRIQSDALSAQQDYFVALSGLERAIGVELWPDDHHEETSP
jgi:cobalt-zinc-cadmium efflux system outer membrane protein